MMKRIVVAVTVLLSVGLSAQSTVKKELEPLQGGWSLITAGGQQVPAGMSVLMITGDKYEGLSSGKVDERGTIKLDPSTKPMSIDLTISEGASAGKVQLGVVEVAGETMTLFLAEPGDKTRPSASSLENKMILKRIK